MVLMFPGTGGDWGPDFRDVEELGFGVLLLRMMWNANRSGMRISAE